MGVITFSYFFFVLLFLQRRIKNICVDTIKRYSYKPADWSRSIYVMAETIYTMSSILF